MDNVRLQREATVLQLEWFFYPSKKLVQKMSYGYGMGPESGPIVSSETASSASGYTMPHHQAYNQAQELAPPQAATSIGHLLEQIMNITDQVRIQIFDTF